MEQAIAGHSEALKERLIGVELFGRSPSYDTGDDAIVRVTASDVRRRLLQHYGVYGAGSDFRITLPQGSYVPEITRSLGGPKEKVTPVAAADHASGHVPLTDRAETAIVELHAPAAAHAGDAETKISPRSRAWLAIGLALTIFKDRKSVV